MTQFFCRYGVPYQLHSDQGTDFESALFQEVCKLLRIEKTRTSPYRPQSDGLVERCNRTIQTMLKAFVNENRNDWDDHLPFVMLAYRSTIQDSTGCSPNLIMFGRELYLPIDLMRGPPPQQHKCPIAYVEWIRGVLNEAHSFAREQLGKAAERQKRNYNNKFKKSEFAVGQWVWYHYPPKARG